MLPPEPASAFTSTDQNHRPSPTIQWAEKIRLSGIDCAEKNQDFGTKAKHITSILVFAKVVEVDPVTTDRYGRTVAFVRVGDTVVNKELIRQGLARVFTRYCDRAICQAWQVLETEAREKRRGVWSMPNAIPPWEFRRSRILTPARKYSIFNG